MYSNELKLFQRSNDSIWTDEYIGKSLLKVHLDENSDGASRKFLARTDIINWINSKIEPNSQIIDLGCGPGLYAYEFGTLGHKILGIDFNQESIGYAQKNNSIKGITEYKCSDYIKDTVDGEFNVAIMIFCDFGALIPSEQKILLQKINSILTDDGVFIFDVFGKSEIKNHTDKRNWYISEGNDFWSKEPYFLLEESKIFENEFTRGTRYYLTNQLSGKIKECIIWDQYYDENSIKQLLSKNGFEVIEINKDIIRYKEETLLVMAKKILKAKTST